MLMSVRTRDSKDHAYGERKFVRTVVRIGMLLQGTHGKVPANITDEVIDEALAARDEIINQNIGSAKKFVFVISIPERFATNNDNSRAELFKIHVEPILCHQSP